MTLNEILALANKVESFNTNNDWGFGGGIGKQYTYPNGVTIRKGTACYRHLPSSPYITVSKNGNRLIDEAKLNKENLLLLTNLINEK